jgi:copper chaperone
MKTTINVKGMHCKSCDILIGEALEEQEGVNSVESTFKTGKVTVTFDESKVTLDKIKTIIKDEGYKVE